MTKSSTGEDCSESSKLKMIYKAASELYDWNAGRVKWGVTQRKTTSDTIG